MSVKKLLLLGAFASQCLFIHAQRVTSYHQSFEVNKTISTLVLDLDYPTEVEQWVGDHVLIETTVKMKNASRQLMDYFIANDRYTIIKKDYSAAVGFGMKKMVRKAIQTKKGICEEDILYKIYVPQHLEIRTTGKPTITMGDESVASVDDGK